MVFGVGGDSGRKGKEKEDSDDEIDDGSCFLGEIMREGWREIAAFYGRMMDAKEEHMVGFLLSLVSNVCRMDPTKIVCLCCGLGDDCVLVGMDKVEMDAREVCSLADVYEIMKSKLDDKRQKVGDLEEDVKELKKTIARLKGEVKFQKRLREED